MQNFSHNIIAQNLSLVNTLNKNFSFDMVYTHGDAKSTKSTKNTRNTKSTKNADTDTDTDTVIDTDTENDTDTVTVIDTVIVIVTDTANGNENGFPPCCLRKNNNNCNCNYNDRKNKV